MSFFRRKFTVMIVCSANRTRSAYLAGYLRHFLTQYRPGAQRRIKIISAGTHAINGARANDVVALIARNNGFSLRNHAAQRINGRLLRTAGLVLVMEQEHKDYILKKFPEARSRTFRLMEYGWQGEDDSDLDVPDPTGKDADDFKAFLATAHAEADRIIHEWVYQEII
ncbi:MAG: hypothetical protein WC959_08625 [Kiritimatiellales bacterium]